MWDEAIKVLVSSGSTPVTRSLKSERDSCNRAVSAWTDSELSSLVLHRDEVKNRQRERMSDGCEEETTMVKKGEFRSSSSSSSKRYLTY